MLGIRVEIKVSLSKIRLTLGHGRSAINGKLKRKSGDRFLNTDHIGAAFKLFD